MRKHFIRMSCTMFVMFILVTSLFSLSVLANIIGYDTKCGACGHDNVQWINEDKNTVHYCEKCGAVGNVWPIYEKTGNDTSATKEDDRTSSYETDTDEEEIPVEVVVGTAAAVVVVAAAMANAKKAKKKNSGKTPSAKAPASRKPASAVKPQNKQNEPEPEKPAGYILQLTQDQITLTAGAEAVVGIRVLKVDDKGQTIVASNAEIYAQQHKDTRILLTPNTGMGVLNMKISQNGAIEQDMKEVVRIAANVPGKTIEASLTVTLTAGLRMVFF